MAAKSVFQGNKSGFGGPNDLTGALIFFFLWCQMWFLGVSKASFSAPTVFFCFPIAFGDLVFSGVPKVFIGTKSVSLGCVRFVFRRRK